MWLGKTFPQTWGRGDAQPSRWVRGPRRTPGRSSCLHTQGTAPSLGLRVRFLPTPRHLLLLLPPQRSCASYFASTNFHDQPWGRYSLDETPLSCLGCVHRPTPPPSKVSPHSPHTEAPSPGTLPHVHSPRKHHSTPATRWSCRSVGYPAPSRPSPRPRPAGEVKGKPSPTELPLLWPRTGTHAHVWVGTMTFLYPPQFSTETPAMKDRWTETEKSEQEFVNVST